MKTIFKTIIIFVFLAVNLYSQPTNDPNAEKVLLPNGWSLTPAGKSLPLGDLPLNIKISPDKKYLAVTNNGQSKQTIQLIDITTEKIIDEQSIGKSWYGLSWSADSKKLFASGGNDNIILVYPIEKKKLGVPDKLKLGEAWPKEKICPTGIDIDDKKQILYIVTKENNSLYLVDIKAGKTINKVDLGSEAYSCQLSKDKNELFISLWGDDKIAVYNVKENKIVSEIATESHPNELLLSKNGKYLFVANANSNSVSVIEIEKRKVIETISTSLFPTDLTGSTTNGLALSEDEKTLYIANADNNCLAVFDVSVPGKSHSKGFIPTGWYPTNVKVLGKKIYVSNGKGFSSLANPEGPQPISKNDDSKHHKGVSPKKNVQYIAGLFKGTLSIIDVPNEKTLEKYSKQVYSNTPLREESATTSKGEAGNPIPKKLGEKSVIKHVFYVIKENRTYDQVLGDMKEGNGDSSLCIFPERVTPNLHALSREFVLLDNFYVDAEVSADGHNWSTAAYATDYVEKTWPTSYGNRGGTYDYEGTRKVAFPKDGFIWDYCKRNNVSYRSYGEFVEEGKPNIKALENHYCKAYLGWDLNFKDIERIKLWKADFDSLLKINAVPQFNTIRLPNDHTSGQSKGAYSPLAAVGDNDLAVGLLIEYISKSPIWKESAIFILEDDAQNGPDHVDAHRSTAYVVSPYIKKHSVNHTMYSTSGMLRTMELIVGLPPMSQYDAAALPLFDCFTSTPDTTTYESKPAQVDIEERNISENESSRRSIHWDFTKMDAAPDLDLNEVIWKSVKGENSVMPAPRRSAFVKMEKKKKDDD